MTNEMSDRLERIEKILTGASQPKKEILNFKEACEYIGLSTSCMYKMTSQRRIPFSRPGGKRIFFKRVDLDAWMQSNRYAASYEVDRAAGNYILHNLKQAVNG